MSPPSQGQGLRRPALSSVLHLALVVALAAACGGGPAATDAPSPPTPSGTAQPALTPSPVATAATPATPGSGGTPPASPDVSGVPLASPTGAPAQARGWQELTQSGARPGPREDQTWTLDAAGAAAYLFGGRAAGRASDELWRYDLAADSWTRLEPDGVRPPARFGHVAAWAEGVGLVVWSGQAGPDFFTDIWAYDPAADEWRELPAEGDVPPARYGSCGGIGPDGRLWISHGFTDDGGRFADTRAYDFASGTWTDVTPADTVPVERCLHDCLWTADGRLVLYAGQTTGVQAIGDLWAYSADTGAWTQAAEPEPEARQLYAMARVGETAYVFGGGSLGGEMLGDLWQLDLADLAWDRPNLAGPSPQRRAGATLLADPARSRLLLFGGTTGASELDDLWELPLVGD